MNLVKSEKLENSKHELQFSVDAAAFNEAVEKAFKREGRKYSIPGFRKGKAPRHMIEKMYGADIFHYDAINDIFPEAYEAAVKETGIEPVDRPEVEVVSMSAEEGAVLKAVVTVKPEVKIGEYKGLEAVKTVKAVEDSAVDAEIDRMRERNARILTREGKAENGDITDIDFEGFIDGTAFEGGKGEHFSLTLGSGQFIPGFEDQIVGHNAGDAFDVNVTFPEDYHAEELKGKPAVFKVVLHEINAKELPEVDDEFAKDVSEFDTLDALKEDIRKRLAEANEKTASDAFENKLIDTVIENLEGEIPEEMYEVQIDEMIRDFEYRLNQQGLELNMYLQYTGMNRDSFRKTFEAQAQRRVKVRLALEKIVELEKIEATEEEIEKEYARLAEAYKMDVEKIKGIIPSADVAKDIASNKAIDLIRDSAVAE